ncbi:MULTISPECIES: hypothetical protein [unclassified Nocardiopsis]|uniref:hypothetical protein n=1 Tax=unclassified Nocardiopsis TaxID=2649073 RepID=UPI00135C562D|nr:MULTISPECIES: hypothetical protein [unclassified Nocardiopsis]
MARKTTPAKADDATAPTEATPAKSTTPRRPSKAATPAPAEVTTPATEKKENNVSESTTPAEAPEAEAPKTVTIDIPGHGPVEVPAETVTEAAKKLAPAKRSTRPELPSEAWKLDPKYRRYSEAVTYVVDLKDPDAQAAGFPEPVQFGPGVVLEWAGVCETHGERQFHRSKGAATYAAADSMLWCGGCESNVKAAADKATEATAKATAEKSE